MTFRLVPEERPVVDEERGWQLKVIARGVSGVREFVLFKGKIRFAEFHLRAIRHIKLGPAREDYKIVWDLLWKRIEAGQSEELALSMLQEALVHFGYEGGESAREVELEFGGYKYNDWEA